MNKRKIINIYLVILGLLLSGLATPLNAQSKLQTFFGCTLITVGLCHVATSFQITPYLYEKNKYKTPEKYLDFLDTRIARFKFLLEKPNEEQLDIFRYELLDYYEHVTQSNSSWLSFFEGRLSHQPWVLLEEEIEQHLSRLFFYKLYFVLEKDFPEKSDASTAANAQSAINRVNILESTLHKIKKRLQSWPSYCNEKSHARQESKTSSMLNLLSVFYCFYWGHKMLKFGLSQNEAL